MKFLKKRRNQRTNRNQTKFSPESLEVRKLFSADFYGGATFDPGPDVGQIHSCSLNINGTNQDDLIVVTEQPGTWFSSLRVTVNGRTQNRWAGSSVCVHGFDGNDRIYLYTDKDVYVSGGDGNDTLLTGGGNDVIDGGAGHDTIFSRQGDDTVNAGSGNDFVYGGPDDDLIYGGSGRDTLYGVDGNDKLYGEADRDVLYGGANDDYLDGGHDGIMDVLQGGAGSDTFIQHRNRVDRPWPFPDDWRDEDWLTDVFAGDRKSTILHW